MSLTQTHCPDASAILMAQSRIKPFINHTPVLTSTTIDRLIDAQVFFKCENFQKVGAFKARGASNAVLSLEQNEIINGVATHSSGNHAQALSWAASLVNTKAYIVMPKNSSKIKVEAVKDYGGFITFCEPTLASREETLAMVIKKTGAVEIHPYNDYRVIAGQATAAKELIEEINDLDLILVPVGGGGLLSGTSLSAYYFSSHTKVIAVEPANADDAWKSFNRKQFVPSVNPLTIADGLRTSLGDLTFPIIMKHVEDIVTVTEGSIAKAMRYLLERMKILVEPSSAVPFAALLEKKLDIRKTKIGVILTGGNVDLDSLPWLKHE